MGSRRNDFYARVLWGTGDFNACLTAGWYTCAAPVNAPTSAGYNLQVQVHNEGVPSAAVVIQTAYAHADGAMHTAGQWPVITSGNECYLNVLSYTETA